MKTKGISFPLAIIALVTFLLTLAVFARESKLSQKKGIYQDLPEKQIQFEPFEEIEIDFDQVPLRKITKINFQNDRIYILDIDRAELYVLDKTGKLLLVIGRPGQGPGDLEYPCDFFISKDGKIYVLNTLPSRVEIFNLHGKSLGSFRFQAPFEFSFANAIIADDQYAYLGFCFNHLIARFDFTGKYIDTILKRKKPIDIYERHANFKPELDFSISNKDENILIFDSFRGILGLLTKRGNEINVFSAMYDIENKEVQKIEMGIKKESINNKRTKNAKQSLCFIFWSNFCQDQDGNIYIFSLGDVDKQLRQKMVVFNQKGDFLYDKRIEIIDGNAYNYIGCDGRDFIFINTNFQIFLAKRRKT